MCKRPLKSFLIWVLLVFSFLSASVIYARSESSRYVLHVESIGNESKFMVFVNGRLVFEAMEGQLTYEITPQIRKGKNKIRVIVENRKDKIASFHLTLVKDAVPFSGKPFHLGKEDKVLAEMKLSGRNMPNEDILTEVKEFFI